MTDTDANSLFDEGRRLLLLLHVCIQVASVMSIQGNDSHGFDRTTAADH